MKRREFIALVGGAVAWPAAARAQQSTKVHRIAIVHPTAPAAEITATRNMRAFFAELSRLGYVEGGNLLVDRYSGEGRSGFAELAREVVDRRPDLIFAISLVIATPMKEATTTIPIVATVSDPVAAGLAVSLARPGGNITGVAIDVGLDLWEKRFELLRNRSLRAHHQFVCPVAR